MKTSKSKIARLDIEVLTDLQNDVRQNFQALADVVDNNAFYVSSGVNLKGHLHNTVGSLMLLHDALDLEIESRKLELDYGLVSQNKH